MWIVFSWLPRWKQVQRRILKYTQPCLSNRTASTSLSFVLFDLYGCFDFDRMNTCQEWRFKHSRSRNTPFFDLGVYASSLMTPSRHSPDQLVASLLALRHIRHMAWTSTFVQEQSTTDWITSLDRISDGLDWLGTLSIQAIKSRASSEEHTKRMIKSIFSLTDLHLITGLVVRENY